MSPGQVLAVLPIQEDGGLVLLRKGARDIAAHLGFDSGDQVRIATAASEVGRIVRTQGGGRAEFLLEAGAQGRQLLSIRFEGQTAGNQGTGGQGTGGLNGAQAPEFSPVLHDPGIVSARRLMDYFDILDRGPGRSAVLMGKTCPPSVPPPSAAQIRKIARLFDGHLRPDPMEEIQRQNSELIATLSAARDQHEALEQLNSELEHTNRGVVALYDELDHKAEALKKASELKTRFLSNMSHEFRTPLNSIVALSRLLLDRVDGPLTEEQEKQVSLIGKAAFDLRNLVNDLLDIAKVESGRVDVSLAPVLVPDLLRSLRGILRPLVPDPEVVNLVFEEPGNLPPLVTDEQKLAQILRNLVSNALKFTERGEVRLVVSLPAPNRIAFTVRDTGIGIPPEQQEEIFEEFAQVANRLQAESKGTGLGLPLSRRLADLLGGTLTVASEVGEGSAFTLELPILAAGEEAPAPATAGQRTILTIDDEPTARYVVRRACAELNIRVIEAADPAAGLKLARSERPDLIFLDLRMPVMSGYEVLAHLKQDSDTRRIPVVVVTSSMLTLDDTGQLKAAARVLSKDALSRDRVASLLQELLPGYSP